MTLSINLQIELEKVSGSRRLRDHLALETCGVSGLNDIPKVIRPGKIKAGTYAPLYYGQVFVQFSVRAKHALLSTGGVEYAKKT